MLRTRPDTCPRCHADARGAPVCPRCRGALVREPLPSSAAIGGGADPMLVALVGTPIAAFAALLPVTTAIVVGVPAVAYATYRVARGARSMVARRRARSEASSVRAALESLGTDPAREVSVRGRVRTLIPAAGHPRDHAIVLEPGVARAGRFAIEDESGAALVDDDALIVLAALDGPELPRACVRDGVEVVVRGRARAISSGEGYRERGRAPSRSTARPKRPSRSCPCDRDGPAPARYGSRA